MACRSPFRPSSQRGSALIVALLLMAVVALGLVSYLNLSLGSGRMARRGYEQTAAFGLAEAGAEEAVWSFNRANADAAGAEADDAWERWTVAGGAARATFDGFDFGGNVTGKVKVYVANYTPTGTVRPTVVALAAVSAPGDTPVTKMLELTLSRRSRFSAGLMARNSITFSGTHTSVDSWNSGQAPAAPVDYGPATRNDQGSVASVSVGNTAVLVNQADVYGYVYTGGAQPQVGAQGSITGRNTPPGVQIDPTRVGSDFTANFPSVSAPEGGEVISSFSTTLGEVGKSTSWRATSLTLSGNQTLTILGDVTLVLTAGPGTTALSVTGNASIIIPAGSSLKVYTVGDVLIAGNGLANGNVRPASFQLYGTVDLSEPPQDLQIAGNGALRAAVFAPNGNVKLNGNGDMMGAVVGNNITLTGNASFHYDEALGALNDGMPYGVSAWRELTSAADRQSYIANFNGW